MPHTSLTLTDNEFIDRFQPEQDTDGSYYRQRDWTVPADQAVIEATDPRCIWTCMDDGEGGVCIGDGWHHVNRLYYIITAVPCPPDTSITVLDD